MAPLVRLRPSGILVYTKNGLFVMNNIYIFSNPTNIPLSELDSIKELCKKKGQCILQRSEQT